MRLTRLLRRTYAQPMSQCSLRFHITLLPPLPRNSQGATLPAAKNTGRTLPLFSFPHFLSVDLVLFLRLCSPFLRYLSSLIFFCLSYFLPFALKVVDLGAGRQPGQGARPEQTVGLLQGTVLYYSIYPLVTFNV